ncbi:hypothetical protein Q7W17_11700 [Streptococcus suis]|nr:hypothetical protein [Streptococcus suis]MBY5039762.1 hypothetical protein [Streptococcus suis]MDW8682747.1 hypothetical protein [Streptococcus suis]HEM6345238.1 hypothetical protein [Streptococcus suis]
MSLINQLKSQSKTVLAAVAISAATLGFAGGMSISKTSTAVSTQSQAALAQNATTTSGQTTQAAPSKGMPPGQEGEMQDIPPGQVGEMQGMPPGQGGEMQGKPPRQGGEMQGMPPGQSGNSQGMTPPNATSGATQSNSSKNSTSNTSSDEVNALKEKNQEIKSKMTDSSSTSSSLNQ